MNEALAALIMGAALAFVLQGLKLMGLTLPNQRTALRLLVAAAALVIAYLALRDQADLAVETVLTYAASVIASAELVYRWILKYITEKTGG